MQSRQTQLTASIYRKILQENRRAMFAKMTKTADQHDGLK